MPNTNSILVGKGHLSQRVAKVTRRVGAELVNYTDPGCSCRWGCQSLGKPCPQNRRHWFEIDNQGDYQNRVNTEKLQAALKTAGCKI